MESRAPKAAHAPALRADETHARRSLYEGFGNALGQAVELVVTPLLFTLLGVWLDGRLDTRPACTVAMALVGLLGVAVKAYYRYDERMAAEEQGKPWKR